MLVDDSAVIRGLLKRLIDRQPDMKVVASVSNGRLAVERQQSGGIDVIILDVEMPVMDGLAALPKLLAIDPDLKIIMSSTVTRKNADISLDALERGAADYIAKPESVADMGGTGAFEDALTAKIRAFGHRRSGFSEAGSPETEAPGLQATGVPSVSRLSAAVGPIQLRPSPDRFPPLVIAIGSSTGGPQALFEVIRNLSPAVKQPILITQHMPPSFTASLATHISTIAGRDCREGVEGEPVLPDRIYLAPGDYHMTVKAKGLSKTIHLDQNPPENYCRPAVDPLFRSIAKAYGSRVLSVVLTGMGSDGSRGAQVIADGGGTVITQDEATSVVWGMPSATAALGICSAVLPLDRVAPYINQFVARDRL